MNNFRIFRFEFNKRIPDLEDIIKGNKDKVVKQDSVKKRTKPRNTTTNSGNTGKSQGRPKQDQENQDKVIGH